MVVESLLPILVFVIPTACGIISLSLRRINSIVHGTIAVAGLLGTLCVAILITTEVLRGNVLTAFSNTVYADGLSALMELLGCGMGILVAIYSLRYIPVHVAHRSDAPQRLSTYYGLLLLFLGMMNWTCVTNNIVWLYVTLEATTLATAFLVTFYWDRRSLEAGYKYLMLVTVGVIFSLFGLVLIYAGAIELPEMKGRDVLLITELSRVGPKISYSVVLLANALILAGFGAKAGLVPFHAWLPDAHAEAPAPISALLSGIVIKVGAYAMARTVTIFAPQYPAVVVFVAIMASLSMVTGILMALVQDDIKRMLAYSSVSQIGYVVEGLGFGTYLGIYGALFHLMNHTIVKALLFLTAGAVAHVTGTRRMSELGGLARHMPVVAVCFFIGAIAIGGLPPFNMFMSKFTLFMAAADVGLLWAAVIAVFTGLLTVACFLRAAARIFWGAPCKVIQPAAVAANGGEVRLPITMLIPMVILAILTIALGIYPGLVHPLLDSATMCILKILHGGV
jgi:hydrogenase-4 component F